MHQEASVGQASDDPETAQAVIICFKAKEVRSSGCQYKEPQRPHQQKNGNFDYARLVVMLI